MTAPPPKPPRHYPTAGPPKCADLCYTVAGLTLGPGGAGHPPGPSHRARLPGTGGTYPGRKRNEKEGRQRGRTVLAMLGFSTGHNSPRRPMAAAACAASTTPAST